MKALLSHLKITHGPYLIPCRSQDAIELRLLGGRRVMYCPTYLWFWEHVPATRLMWEAQERMKDLTD